MKTLHSPSRMLILVMFITVMSGSYCLSMALEPPSGDPSIIAPGAKLVKIFGEGIGSLEGPAMSPDGILYFSDFGLGMDSGHIWELNPETGKAKIFLSPSGKSNGLAFDAKGRLIVAQGAELGGRRIIRVDTKTRKSTILAAVYNGLPFSAPNDITIDGQGRIYFTDPSYMRHNSFEPIYQPIQGVYRIDLDGSVHLVIANAVVPNGLVISPDQKTLYVVSTDMGSLNGWTGTEGLRRNLEARFILVYELMPDGSASFRGRFADYDVDAGTANIDGVSYALKRHVADGLTIDVDGNVYAALPIEQRIGVFSPGGSELASVPLPQGCLNVTFGRGKYSKALFITSGNSVYMIDVLKEGHHLPAGD